MTTKKRILVIDDDKTVSKMVVFLFNRIGHEVHTAFNGPEGLKKADEVKPDLVILDMMMPGMTGLEVCQRLRANPSTSWIPIIMLSARADVDDKVSGLQAGADDYIRKPVAPKELVARVESLLQRLKRVQPPKGQIIAVVGAKGGVGVTTVAVNVAITLASKGHPTILAELRNVHGTVANKFHLSPSQDLGGLLSLPPEQIDRSDVIRRLVRHSSGLRVLIAPQQATDELLTAAHVESIVELLSIEAAYLILDLPYVGSKAPRAALERSDQILLVTEPEMLSIASTRADLETLDTWGLRDRINLVVNTRSRSNTSITPLEIEEKLGLSLIATIPPAPEVFQAAAGMGKPIVLSRPEELAATTLIKLANQLEAAGK